jgi:hypothetical protein
LPGCGLRCPFLDLPLPKTAAISASAWPRCAPPFDGRLTTVAEVGAALSAGTNCGSCVPEIKTVLRDTLAEAAA